MSIETFTIETIVTGLTQDNIQEKLKQHLSRIELDIKLKGYTELKIKSTVRSLSPKEAKIYTSFEGK